MTAILCCAIDASSCASRHCSARAHPFVVFENAAAMSYRRGSPLQEKAMQHKGLNDSRSYWIGVVSRDHVQIGVAGGFTQLNHGKAGPLERMRPGDGFVFYSPRTEYPDGAPLQAFTAIGLVRARDIYQAGGAEASPFRRAVEYLPANEAPIKPLLPELSFIRSKEHWGAAFRFGLVRVPEEDFARIAAAMGRDFARDFPREAAITT
jgi:hypothetical protein